jgi:hypothetical protein
MGRTLRLVLSKDESERVRDIIAHAPEPPEPAPARSRSWTVGVLLLVGLVAAVALGWVLLVRWRA